MYGKCLGVGKDDSKADHWFTKAANQGYAKAQCNLGFMYERGLGVDKDVSKAVDLFEKSAKQGIKQAQIKLVEMYKIGSGVPIDLKKSTYWYMLGGLENGDSVRLIHDYSKLLKHISSVLIEFADFSNVNKLIFSKLEISDEDFLEITKFIKSNSHPKILSLSFDQLSTQNATMLAQSLKNNTHLIELTINDDSVNKEVIADINTSLSQNRSIAELRGHIDKHPPLQSNFLPLEVLSQIIDPMIVASLKKDQSKEATLKAIDEFLLSAAF